MASGTPPTNKRNSLQRLSHIFQLASPSFVRLSLDGNSAAERKKVPRPNGSPLATTSPTQQESFERGYNPTASILSTAESNLSSPLSPLLPATPRTPASLDEFPLPPTLNELAANEKAMLMRKMKKLSKVLGEMPVPQVVDEETTVPGHRLSAVMEEQRLTLITPFTRPSVSDAAKRAFRRSFTVGHHGGHHVKALSEVHRVRSLSSLRPSLAIPAPARHSADSSYSPITFAYPDGERRGNTPNASVPPHEEPVANDSDAQSIAHKSPKRRDSTASSILLADQNPEQMQRTRVAKLSRYLGENVPPEILRRAASPPPRSSSPPLSPHIIVDESALELCAPVQPFALANKRPLSLDASALKATNRMSSAFSPSAPSSPTFPDAPNRTETLRRSRSMWAKRGEDELDEEFHQELTEHGCGVANEKQRALNVRRARKLTQASPTSKFCGGLWLT